ncbi:rhamnan synthesis F family protein [Pseudomonas sp. NBRC 111134]|uniref:rhamnan synthesis F family protein n=1 Tax=Pseudomonas sp. NBRC 111134 TaxID=1661049 RepID=UPI00076145BD|nr:rhamnan synthesis F family protein [Pseudomonas sp. NBRC 111134]
MHLPAHNYGRLFLETYRNNLPVGSKVVVMGAQHLGGSPKDICPQGFECIGVDTAEGMGVDIVLDSACALPFEAESVDAVICSSCLGHADMFWVLFNEFLRILKPSGLLCIIAPNDGDLQRRPLDCWRFYPDAGRALVNWAQRSGYPAALLESFVGPQAAGHLNVHRHVFVGIFAKDAAAAAQFDNRMFNGQREFSNALLSGSAELLNPQEYAAGARLLEQLREENAALQGSRLHLQAQLAEAQHAQQRLLTQLADAASAPQRVQEQLRAQLAEAHSVVAEAHNALAAARVDQETLAALRDEVVYVRSETAKAREESNSLRQQLALKSEQAKRAADEFASIVQGIHHSSSWRVTAPMRVLSRVVRGQRPLVAGGLRARVLNQIKPLYWAIPHKYRNPLLNWGYRNLAFVFRGSPHYEMWKNGSQPHIEAVDNTLITLDGILPAEQVEGSIAIHLHMYYEDLASEFAGYLRNMPFAYDLYVSVKDAEGQQVCQAAFAQLPNCEAQAFQIVNNRGRDIAPMFVTFGEALRGYDYVAHLHSKKSLYNAGATEGWRQYLAGNLLGSTATIRRIFTLMAGDKGIVYPQNFKSVPSQANTWLANKGMGAAWCARLGIAPVPQGYFDFPAGSMFWARGDAMRPLFSAGITIEDFIEEAGQTDGTFAHCLERLLVLSTRKQGLQPGIIQDTENPTWSSWRLDQSVGRPYEWMVGQFSNPAIKCIGFDIFDTLLIRPLIDAETTKHIVAANLPEHLSELFRDYRVLAEGQARKHKGKDVDLDDIYQAFGQLSKLSEQDVQTIRKLEEHIEYRSLSARSGGVELFEAAKATGKPVVLISDMFLPKALITRALNANGVDGWTEFYLSNEVGLRKDTGQLYDHVLQTYGLQPAEFIMVGDNERSDLQIPCDKGCVGLHILRPTELARGTPRLRSIVERYEFAHDLNAELTLGLLFQKNFPAVVYPNLNPGSLFHATPYNIGYSLVGPMLTGMAQWLIDNARREGVEQLHFLAREGQLMKAAYDVWAEDVSDAPPSKYLVVSRRTCSVPLLDNLNDVLTLGKGDYYLNTASNYLLERFGLTLSDAAWSELQTELNVGRDTQVEVRNGNLAVLAPVLTKLAETICKQAEQEREALVVYLKGMELMGDQRNAVVDVGYGATIQNYLCKLTGQKLSGYYLATDERSIPVAEQHGVIVRGCLMHNVEHSLAAPIMYLRSFELEKLLSSSDGQVVKYTSTDGVNVEAHYRELSIQERDGDAFRNDLRNGVLQFARDAVRVRTQLLGSFAPSLEVSRAIADEFFSKHSTDELKLLGEVMLDDHYCGRGVV